MILRSLFYFFMISVVFFSCSGTVKEDTPNPGLAEAPAAVVYDSSLEKGKIIPSLVCRVDPSQSYALYLPSNYTPSKAWPIIFFFDPHAKGTDPLERYKDLAEKYGYILAASNNSKNGNAWELTQQIASNFFYDVEQRVNAAKLRIYTAGFSGGGKVAASLANFNGGIAGVIACGAPLPFQKDALKNRFDLFGVAGRGDFNYTEMRQINGTLDNWQLRHQLITFDGKHEWAPKESMQEAFMWFELNAMKDKLIPKIEDLIKQVKDEHETKL
jgi:hypothetical protein